jgi:hypothetical protein
VNTAGLAESPVSALVTGQPDSKSAVPLADQYLFEPLGGVQHELCSAGDQSWLNGLLDNKHVLTESFHPNQAGETAMGKLAAPGLPEQPLIQ